MWRLITTAVLVVVYANRATSQEGEWMAIGGAELEDQLAQLNIQEDERAVALEAFNAYQSLVHDLVLGHAENLGGESMPSAAKRALVEGLAQAEDEFFNALRGASDRWNGVRVDLFEQRCRGRKYLADGTTQPWLTPLSCRDPLDFASESIVGGRPDDEIAPLVAFYTERKHRLEILWNAANDAQAAVLAARSSEAAHDAVARVARGVQPIRRALSDAGQTAIVSIAGLFRNVEGAEFQLRVYRDAFPVAVGDVRKRLIDQGFDAVGMTDDEARLLEEATQSCIRALAAQYREFVKGYEQQVLNAFDVLGVHVVIDAAEQRAGTKRMADTYNRATAVESAFFMNVSKQFPRSELGEGPVSVETLSANLFRAFVPKPLTMQAVHALCQSSIEDAGQQVLEDIYREYAIEYQRITEMTETFEEEGIILPLAAGLPIRAGQTPEELKGACDRIRQRLEEALAISLTAEERLFERLEGQVEVDGAAQVAWERRARLWDIYEFGAALRPPAPGDNIAVWREWRSVEPRESSRNAMRAVALAKLTPEQLHAVRERLEDTQLCEPGLVRDRWRADVEAWLDCAIWTALQQHVRAVPTEELEAWRVRAEHSVQRAESTHRQVVLNQNQFLADVMEECEESVGRAIEDAAYSLAFPSLFLGPSGLQQLRVIASETGAVAQLERYINLQHELGMSVARAIDEMALADGKARREPAWLTLAGLATFAKREQAEAFVALLRAIEDSAIATSDDD